MTKNRRFTWADAISLTRIPLAGAFIFADTTTAQSIIVGAAALTDFIDGKLARRFGQTTRAGEIIDPVSDKLFVLTTLVMLVLRGQMRIWEVVLLLIRDIYNTFAYVILRTRKRPIRFRARLSGKIVTSLQVGSILVFLLLPGFFHFMLALTVVAAIWAVYDYTQAGLHDLRQAPRAG